MVWSDAAPLVKGPSMLLLAGASGEAAAARAALEAAWPGVWVAAVADGAQARAWLAAAPAWLLAIVDLDTCPASGLGLIAALAERQPSLPILAIAAEDDLTRAVSALHVGARGCLFKPLGGAALVRGARQTLQGEAPVTARLLGPLLQTLPRPVPRPAAGVRP